MGYVSELLKDFALLLSLGIFHKLHGIASMLSCLEMNRDFLSGWKILTVQPVMKVFVQLRQHLAEQRI